MRFLTHQSSCWQAVIGAGAGGLVAARELRRQGHRVTVFEQGGDIGGVWLYDDAVDEDPLARNPQRRCAASRRVNARFGDLGVAGAGSGAKHATSRFLLLMLSCWASKFLEHGNLCVF